MVLEEEYYVVRYRYRWTLARVRGGADFAGRRIDEFVLD